ncbi:MAG: RHS repeat-associated core domain-containing protein [Candidatus Thiodiazotropha sp.]
MSTEPRLKLLLPGEHNSMEGLFNGVKQGSCIDYYKFNVLKKQGDEWVYREVLRCARYISNESFSNLMYLWLKGIRYRMEKHGDVYLQEGGHDRDLIIEPVSATSITGAAWRLRQADDSISYFDSNGLILANLFTNGDRVDYHYDQDKLISKADQRGRTLSYQYDADGRLDTIILPNGDSIQYGYQGETPGTNEFWLLSRVEWPNGESVGYSYNEAGYIRTEPDRFLTGRFDAYGNRIGTYKYDATDKAYSTEGYEGERKRAIRYSRGKYLITNSNGAVEQLYFRSALSNGKLLLTNKIQPVADDGTVWRKYIYYNNDGKPREVRFNGSTTQYAYDLDHKLRIVSVTGINPTPRTALTNEGVTLPTGARKQTTQWDSNLRKPLKIAEPKLITTYIYNGNPDPFNNDIPADCSSAQIDGDPLPVVCRVVRQATTDEDGSQGLNASLDPQIPARHRLYTYNDEGQILTSASSPDYHIETTYTYYLQAGTTHKKGDLQSITNALGHRVEYLTYDDHGNPIQIRNANGVLNEMSYDHRNRLTSYTNAGLTTILTYDLNGNLITVTTPDGQTLNREYDGAGRVSALVDAQLNRMEYTYDLESNRLSETLYDASGTTLFSKVHQYDALNRVAKHIDASTEETSYLYDAEGKITRVTDANLNPTAQTYDALDRLKQQTDALDGTTQYTYDAQDNLTSITDPNGLTTTYDYDGLGNLISQTSPDTGSTTYTYDEAGNRLTQTDARGVTVSYSYDALNRLTHVSYPDTSLNVTYTYDQGTHGIGKLSSMSDAHGTTSYTYNAYGDLITQTRTSSDGIITTFHFDYDTYGRLASLTYPSGNSVNYTFDAQGQLSGLSYEWSDGTTQSLISNLQTLPFGPVKAFDYGNGLSLTRSFDQDYRLIGQTIAGILQSSYQHDPVGNITDWQDLLSTGQDQLFDYDALSRLTSASGAYGDFTYTYDATGNRLSLTLGGSTETYSYVPSSHRLQQILGSVTDSRSYDAAGNTIQSLIGSYTYDDTNRMVGFTKTGTTATYAYNGKGERIQKNVDGTITRFRYGPAGQLLGEYDHNGQVIREYVTLEGQPITLIREQQGADVTLLQNVNLNHITQTVDLGQHATAPVIFASPLTYNGGHGAVVGLDNITPTQASVQVKEWDYLDGGHAWEDLSLLALPPGRYPQADGSIWEVGRFSLSGTKQWHTISFNEAFEGEPYLFLTQQSQNDPEATSIRARNIDTTGFQAYLQEQESLNDGHVDETVGYLAIYSPSQGGTASLYGTSFDYQLSQLSLNTTWTAQGDQQLKIQEEASHDSELGHATETLDILQIEGHLFAQDVTTNGEDTMALRRRGPTSTVLLSGSPTEQGVVYLHTDHLGAVVKATDSDQNLVWDAERKPFGQRTVTTAQIEMPLGFPGQYYDEESNNYYNYFRDYDPSTGRYLQSDPIGLDGGLNTYAYVEGNPVLRNDPFGLAWSPADWGGSYLDPTLPNYKPCQYYNDKCKEAGCPYYCRTAPFVCTLAHDSPFFSGYGQTKLNCIRSCLVVEDQKANNQDGQSDICNNDCLPNNVIDDYHKTCFLQCGADPNDYPGVQPGWMPFELN